MNTEELCIWLQRRLDEEDWDQVKKVLIKENIHGEGLLKLTKKFWASQGVSSRIIDSLFNVIDHNIESFFPEFEKDKIKTKCSFVSWPSRSRFQDIRLSEIPYIDKTMYFQKLFDTGHVFLSRPRRFGKTLLVDTLNNLILGYKDLFMGLDAEHTWNWTNNKFPVIRLDFSKFIPSNFAEGIILNLIHEGKKYGVDFNGCQHSYDAILYHLVAELKDLNFREGRDPSFAIIIDEYDKPIVDMLDSPTDIQKNFKILNNFLSLVKSHSPVFSMVTGSSRLARSAVFSGDNIRCDISFDPYFNSICGFSEQELTKILQNVHTNLSIKDMKKWYNGYCFGGDSDVYNPFSVANALVAGKTDSFWVQSGSPALLSNLCGTNIMKDFIREYFESNGVRTTMKDLFQSEDAESIGMTRKSLQRLFFQTGYLTLRAKGMKSNSCILRIPNKEIGDHALPDLLISGLTKKSLNECHAHFQSFYDAVESRNIEDIYDSVMDLFQVIGYPDRGALAIHEDYYQRILQAFFLAVCPNVRIEDRTSLGRCDLFIESGSFKILFELKVIKRKFDETQTRSAEYHKVDELVTETLLKAKKKYSRGLLPDVICVLIFDASTRTLFPRNSLNVSFFEANQKISKKK
jgi:hypothetical protein